MGGEGRWEGRSQTVAVGDGGGQRKGGVWGVVEVGGGCGGVDAQRKDNEGRTA